jgi:hypothetical protein
MSTGTAQDDIEVKVTQFARAISKYNTISKYMAFENLLGVVIVTLQVLSLLTLIQNYHGYGVFGFMATLFLAYLATDFFNGLTHMIIDNTTQYTSMVGPFIAAFHMHHYKLVYTKKHPLHIYFTESGHKFWLVFYLILLTVVQHTVTLNALLNLGLVAFGIFSSVAELSHYWCHSAKTNALISFLQKHHILLNLKHHRLHHINDNINYAFLNGVSDPLLNVIARHCCKGYKNRSDKHVALYTATVTL